MTDSRVKAIAFFLPQFHPIPENDEWWGKGFTEWRNVAKAKPNFLGHYQPHQPADFGYYDLRVPETRAQQAELAREYGIYGFCFHHYWFGGKRLLEKPVDAMLASGEPDFPYCLCWANENWTRTWDGGERHILMAQQHSPEDSRAFLESLLPHFRDPRYIRVNNAPMLVVYRVDIIPDVQDTIRIWRETAREHGIGELHIVAAQSFGIGDPRPYGCDAAVEFPPHGNRWFINEQLQERIVNPNFTGMLSDVADFIRYSVERPPEDYILYRTAFPAWDNTARRQDKGLAFVHTSPERYEYWLNTLARQTVERNAPEHQYLFINAWNEWAEGAHLEPDQRYGHAWLEATYRVVTGMSQITSLPPPPPLPPLPKPSPATSLDPTQLQGDCSSPAAKNEPTSSPSEQERYRLSLPQALRVTTYAASRAVFRRLPLSGHVRERLLDAYFRLFGPLLKDSPAYRNWCAKHDNGRSA